MPPSCAVGRPWARSSSGSTAWTCWSAHPPGCDSRARVLVRQPRDSPGVCTHGGVDIGNDPGRRPSRSSRSVAVVPEGRVTGSGHSRKATRAGAMPRRRSSVSRRTSAGCAPLMPSATSMAARMISCCDSLGENTRSPRLRDPRSARTTLLRPGVGVPGTAGDPPGRGVLQSPWRASRKGEAARADTTSSSPTMAIQNVGR